jgi:galactoside O-acetyltransferase
MIETSFLKEENLYGLGLQSFGNNVSISSKVSIYGANNLNIGNNVRVDDFCILSGKIQIGNYVHIAAGTFIIAGDAGIIIEDFANISQRVNIFGKSDDYSGETMTSPLVDSKYKCILQKKVIIQRHVIVGAGSVILPGVTLSEGTAVGALSLVSQSTSPWTIYAGTPARAIKPRSKKLLELEKEFLNDKRI